MQIRQIKFIPIQTYSDEVIKLGYLKVLTETKFESLKLPTSLSKYKFQHILSPNNIITAEVIKTRKNWILSSILYIETIYNPKNFNDYMILGEVTKILQTYYHDEQDVNLLQEITDLVNSFNSLNQIFVENFTSLVAKRLGFA